MMTLLTEMTHIYDQVLKIVGDILRLLNQTGFTNPFRRRWGEG